MTMTDKLSALKIVPASYETYLALPKPGRFPLNLPAVNRHFFVYDPELPNGPWGLFNELDFRRNYRFLEKPSETALTPIERVDLEDVDFGPIIGV
jgi:hypothetical protein